MAKKVNLMGKDGVRASYWYYENLYLPLRIGDPERLLQRVEDLKYRDGDIIMSTYPKSGAHWLVELITMLLEGKTNYPDIDFFVNMDLESDLDKLQELPSPRLLRTHLPYRLLPREHKERREKIIVLLRNPKDILVSMFFFIKKLLHPHSYSGTWDEHFADFLSGKAYYGDAIDRILEWDTDFKNNPDHPMLLVLYEDLQKDCVKELRRICKYLNLEREDSFLYAVAEACEFEKMKQSMLENVNSRKVLAKLSADESTYQRKGKIGDWKNHFSVAQNEIYDKMLKDKLQDSSIRFQYE